MSSLRVLQGDFKRGRIDLEPEGFRLRTGSIAIATVPYGAILLIKNLGREKHGTATDKVATTVAGGIIGGIAAGSLAGGLTGPAGAALGAVAGAVISVKRMFATCRVELRDGRSFIAKGLVNDWMALEDLVRRAEPVVVAQAVQVLPPPTETAKRTLLDRALEPIQKRLPGRKPTR
jgi:hypothetical protein